MNREFLVNFVCYFLYDRSMNEDNIKFRPFNKDHLSLIKTWLKKPHVIEFWDNSSFNEPYEEYIMYSCTDGSVVQFLIELDNSPIGYIQYYWASKIRDGWWEGYPDDVVGFDFYIGEPSILGKGIGEKIVNAFSKFLFNIPNVSSIIADPSPKNLKIIHILEKCGYDRIKRISTPDGPAILYKLEK